MSHNWLIGMSSGLSAALSPGEFIKQHWSLRGGGGGGGGGEGVCGR